MKTLIDVINWLDEYKVSIINPDELGAEDLDGEVPAGMSINEYLEEYGDYDESAYAKLQLIEELLEEINKEKT